LTVQRFCLRVQVRGLAADAVTVTGVVAGVFGCGVAPAAGTPVAMSAAAHANIPNRRSCLFWRSEPTNMSRSPRLRNHGLLGEPVTEP
jgi:hypothetical protein